MTTLSPIARLYTERRLDTIRTRVPWGLCFHTTGSGINAKAKKTGKTPIRVALEHYRRSQLGANGYPWGGPGYVIDVDGSIWQMAEDTTRTNHVGANRDAYLSGRWLKLIPPKAVAAWRRQWPNFKTPQHLFPSEAPNTDLIGVEMIPCLGVAAPMRAGLRFTEAQHEAAVQLALDVEQRWGFPKGWYGTPRLCGHEDVGLLDRHDCCLSKNPDTCVGGWDPGWLRPNPHFDFGWVRAMVATRSPK